MTHHLRPIVVLLLAAAAASAAPATPPSTQPNGGWTLLFPGKHQYFVSANGSDQNPGSLESPFQTIGRAVKVVRDGDDLILHRGDTFEGTLGLHKWSNVTISTYGDGDRPTIAVDTTDKFSPFGLLIKDGHDDRVIGVHFTAAHRDPSKPDFRLIDGHIGLQFTGCENILVEDCKIDFFGNGINVEGNTNHGFRLRRSVIANCYSSGKGFSQGIFLDGQVAPVIEECVFDTCGWDPLLNDEWERRQHGKSGPTGSGSVPSTQNTLANLEVPAGQPFPGTPNMFNHGVYNHNGSGATGSTVRGCIFVNCSASGMTQGAGGTIDDCLFIHNGIATDAWTGDGAGSITNCVCLGSKQCPAWAAGGGLTLMSNTGTVENNIVAHGSPPEKGAALMLWAHKGHEAEIPADATASFRHNLVYDWPADGFYVATARSRVEFRANCVVKCPQRTVNILADADAEYVFHNNRYEETNGNFVLKQKPMAFDAFSQAVNETGTKLEPAVHFPDPDRTIETYAKSLGLGSALEAFMQAADNQSRAHWDPRLTAGAVNDYIRQGFGMAKQ